MHINILQKETSAIKGTGLFAVVGFTDLPHAFFKRLVFKTTLLKNACTKPEIEKMVSQTKFTKSRIDEDALGMGIWLEK